MDSIRGGITEGIEDTHDDIDWISGHKDGRGWKSFYLGGRSGYDCDDRLCVHTVFIIPLESIRTGCMEYIIREAVSITTHMIWSRDLIVRDIIKDTKGVVWRGCRSDGSIECIEIRESELDRACTRRDGCDDLTTRCRLDRRHDRDMCTTDRDRRG